LNTVDQSFVIHKVYEGQPIFAASRCFVSEHRRMRLHSGFLRL
jgi:hypothetical protein